MRAWAWRCALAAVLAIAWIAFGQGRGQGVEDPQSDVQLPNGKSQRAEILKAEREQNIKDAAQLVDLSKELQQEIEKNEAYVLSLGTLKKTDEIEKLVKRIRARLRHY
jgi:cell division septation protein DedD